jgi:hypothetical protein
MTDTDNAYRAKGTSPHEAFDFIAYPGEKKTWAPTWGFVTCFKDPGTSVKGIKDVFLNGDSPLFRFGGSFGGWVYGVAAHGGSPDESGNVGPNVVANYSDFAGVFGTGVYVEGVAGTSVLHTGVYGQTGEIATREGPQLPQGIAAGVFGAAAEGQPGVVGWSPNGMGCYGMSYSYLGVVGQSIMNDGVYGVSDQSFGVFGVSGSPGPTVPDAVTTAGVEGTSNTVHGVIGTSNAAIGVYGYSTNGPGVIGRTSNPASVAGGFFGNVGITGNLQVVGTKTAVVPFPDGSQRLLYCMESPELWFEDFGSAKLARGRAVVKIDANFAKVIKRGDYRVFVTPEGNCHGLYVHRKGANNFEVRELTGGKSSIAFSYRIVGRRKDIKQHRRFAKIDMPLPPLTRAPRAPRKPVPTAAGLRAFIARVEKEARERAPKGAEKVRAEMRRNRGRSFIMPPRAR